GSASSLPYQELVHRLRATWAAEGRQDGPRLAAILYFALGEQAGQLAATYLRGYYGKTGDYAERVVANALTSEQDVRRAIREYAAAGCNELLFFPCDGDSTQLDLLARVAL